MTTYEIIDMARPHERHHSDDHNAALAQARALCGPQSPHITIDASTSPTTFGVRHITWHDGQLVESDWRSWEDGEFIGGCNVWPPGNGRLF